ncbi:MAG: ribonuclease Z [Bacteroidaceae bacterium]|nr:ribonuclease Z [Bacteroidaceae bacterium]
MEKFDIHILGCGSALPTTKHLPTSQVVDVRDKLFMIDCAEGSQLEFRRQKLKFTRLNHIFISHLHGDHCFGLMGLISTFGMLGRTADLHIYSPGEDLQRILQPQIDYFCGKMSYAVVFHAVDHKQPQVVYEDRSVTVSTLPLKHRVACCGYLFRERPTLPHIRRDMIDFLGIPNYAIKGIKEGADWTDADGRVWPNAQLVQPHEGRARSYAYCSDTIFRPALAELVGGVDLLFHEATFATSESARAKETFHSTAAQAAMIARDAEVGQLLIGHFSARYDDEQVLLDEARAVFERTNLAREGLKISL